MQAKPYLKLFVLCVLNQEKITLIGYERKCCMIFVQVQQCFFDIFQPLTAVKKEEHILVKRHYFTVKEYFCKIVCIINLEFKPCWCLNLSQTFSEKGKHPSISFLTNQ